jgi:hypothetical protein
MFNATSLTLIVSLTDVLWGAAILFSMYEGNCCINSFWMVFAILLILIGITVPLFTLSPSKEEIFRSLIHLEQEEMIIYAPSFTEHSVPVNEGAYIHTL